MTNKATARPAKVDRSDKTKRIITIAPKPVPIEVEQAEPVLQICMTGTAEGIPADPSAIEVNHPVRTSVGNCGEVLAGKESDPVRNSGDSGDRTGENQKVPWDSKTQQDFVYRSIALFPGRLHLEDDQLFLKCPDDAMFPILAIDQKFSLWLLSHPGELFRPDDRLWLVYPKFLKSRLHLHLKSIVKPESPNTLKPNQARIEGRILKIQADRFLVGIRRNLTYSCFNELRIRNLLQSTGLDQFAVFVWGDAPGQLGDLVKVVCERDGDRLVRSESSDSAKAIG